MKIKNAKIWFGIIIVLIAVIVWFEQKIPAEASTSSVVTNTELTPSNSVTNRLVAAPDYTNALVSSSRTNPALERVERMAGLLSDYNDQSIVFYGKIEDQFSNAVEGAQVNFDVRIKNGDESTVKRGNAISDANGLFTISGYKGEQLGLNVAKNGYRLISMAGSGIYSKLWPEDQRAHPDRNHPTIIKMWKLQGGEPLVKIDNQYRFPFTAEPIFFDLLAGKAVRTGGDIEFIITRAPGIITGRKENRRDWSIKIIPVNGGIIESDYHTAQVTFEAPAGGYQEYYCVNMNHDDPAWFDNINKSFFMNSRGGRVYSRFTLGFMINDDPKDTMYFRFQGVANTNGSRNWEATATINQEIR